MKSILLFLLVLLFAYTANANFVTYKTYDDYVSKKGEVYDDFKKASFVMGSVYLYLKKNDKTIMAACKDLWGFTYNDTLFRVEKKYSQPARVFSIGKIIYYENGYANLYGIRNHKVCFNHYGFLGYDYYVSKDLKSNLIPFEGNQWNDFAAANPIYKPLFTCMYSALASVKSWSDRPLKWRECVKAFESDVK